MLFTIPYYKPIMDINSDTLIHHIYPILRNDSLTLALTNKYYLLVFMTYINQNSLIIQALRRVADAKNEAIKRSVITTTVDRTAMVLKENNLTKLVIYVKVFVPPVYTHDELYCSAVYSSDRWESCYYAHGKLDCNMNINGIGLRIYKIHVFPYVVCKCSHNYPDHAYCDCKQNDTWFAIKVTNKMTKEVFWDNNNGWNYTNNPAYNHIPLISLTSNESAPEITKIAWIFLDNKN